MQYFHNMILPENHQDNYQKQLVKQLSFANQGRQNPISFPWNITLVFLPNTILWLYEEC